MQVTPFTIFTISFILFFSSVFAYSSINSNSSLNKIKEPPLISLRSILPENPEQLISHIHGSGIIGYILIDLKQNGSSLIKLKLDGTLTHEAYSLHIYSYPLLNNECDLSLLGSLIWDISLDYGYFYIGNEYILPSSSPSINLSSLLGRSLVLYNIHNKKTLCSTILANGDNTIYRGNLHYPISGQVYYITTSVGSILTVQWSMYSDGQRKTGLHSWALYETPISSNDPSLLIYNELTNCHYISGYKLFYSSQEENKLIKVSTEQPNTNGRSHHIIEDIKTPSKGIIYLLLFSENNINEILTCIPLIEIKSKMAEVTFNHPQITGNILFKQRSPFEATRIDIRLHLNSPAFSYGIDVLPSIERNTIEDDYSRCSNIDEIIYNPFKIDPTVVPNQGKGTSDQYAIGDLSGKYGTLESKNDEHIILWDHNLPLFGRYSIIGRAFVIYQPNGLPLGCANINLLENMITSYSTYDNNIQGQIILKQSSLNCFDDTYIYIEISRKKPNRHNGYNYHDDDDENNKHQHLLINETTFNHPWSINMNPIKTVYNSLSTDNCKSSGNIFNPFNVSSSCIYQRDCTPFTPNRCKLGDESSKLATIDIPIYKKAGNGKMLMGKYYFIDTELSLCGPHSVIGKSLVIYNKDFDYEPIICSNILKYG